MIIFRFKTAIRRYVNGLLKTYRPSSYPYITCDSFRALAQHIYDDLLDLAPENVQVNDIVFVRSFFLEDFFKKVHPFIKNKYILISHGDDTNITAVYKKYLDDKIIHWFAQNLLLFHPKITPIPIGLISRFRNQENTVIKNIEKNKRQPKNPRIFCCFSMNSNIVREKIFGMLKDYPQAYGIRNYIETSIYTQELGSSKLTVSPPGFGIDCHRTWEALYLGVTPIVEKNTSSLFFKEIGIPLIILERWEDVKGINIENQATLEGSIPQIWMPFWEDVILKTKDKI